MALEISLKPEATKLEIQSDTVVKLKFRNMGRSSIHLPDPENSASTPVLKLREKSSQEEFVFRRVPQMSGMPEGILILKPGETKEWSFWLRDIVRFPHPGRFDLTAEQEWDSGAGVARSEPVLFDVSAVSAQSMALGSAQSDVTGTFFIYWTHISGTKTELKRTQISNVNRAMIAQTIPIDEIPGESEISASIAANKSDPLSAWVVWLQDGRKLAHRFVPAGGGKGQNRVIKLPDLNIRILPNPLMRPSKEGEVLLWLVSKDYSDAKLQLALLDPSGGAGAGSELRLSHAAEPRWAQTVYLSNGDRRAYLAFVDGDEVHLEMTKWRQDTPLEPLQRIHAQQGRFVAAGLSVHENDDITGAIVMQPHDQKDRLSILPWLQRAGAAIEIREVEEVEFPFAASVDRYAIRVNKRREVHIALKPTGQPWCLRRPKGGFLPLGGDAASVNGPVGLFFDSLGRPLLIFAKKEMGLMIQEPDGGTPRQTSF